MLSSAAASARRITTAHRYASVSPRATLQLLYFLANFIRCSLQLWLYHQHNVVTQRVWTEETASNIGGSSNAGALRAELWPSQSQCGACIGSAAGVLNASPDGSTQHTEESKAESAKVGAIAGSSTAALDTADFSPASAVIGNGAYDPRSVDSAAVLQYLRSAYSI